MPRKWQRLVFKLGQSLQATILYNARLMTVSNAVTFYSGSEWCFKRTSMKNIVPCCEALGILFFKKGILSSKRSLPYSVLKRKKEDIVFKRGRNLYAKAPCNMVRGTFSAFRIRKLCHVSATLESPLPIFQKRLPGNRVLNRKV
jgi:hypothetical protein